MELVLFLFISEIGRRSGVHDQPHCNRIGGGFLERKCEQVCAGSEGQSHLKGTDWNPAQNRNSLYGGPQSKEKWITPLW